MLNQNTLEEKVYFPETLELINIHSREAVWSMGRKELK
jgi:hypothetical protein